MATIRPVDWAFEEIERLRTERAELARRNALNATDAHRFCEERDEARAEVERLRAVIAEADRHLRNTVAGMRYREPLPKSVIRAVELTQRDLAAALTK